MEIELEKAQFHDCPEIHSLQVKSFLSLLEKYQDFSTNPAAESLERIEERFRQTETTYWFITLRGRNIGGIRVCDFGEVCRISPIFILPEYQGRGYAQHALKALEKLFPNAIRWELDTIAQEEKLCHLYEKVGYRPTGKTKNIQENMDLVFYEKYMNLQQEESK